MYGQLMFKELECNSMNKLVSIARRSHMSMVLLDQGDRVEKQFFECHFLEIYLALKHHSFSVMLELAN